jgi:hypothetical protein
MIVVVKMNGIVEQREKWGRSPITQTPTSFGKLLRSSNVEDGVANPDQLRNLTSSIGMALNKWV